MPPLEHPSLHDAASFSKYVNKMLMRMHSHVGDGLLHSETKEKNGELPHSLPLQKRGIDVIFVYSPIRCENSGLYMFINILNTFSERFKRIYYFFNVLKNFLHTTKFCKQIMHLSPCCFFQKLFPRICANPHKRDFLL